ncbi:MAG: hypothetical protein JWP55_1504 [Mycobacterium sp.]|jgi:hypothetical protein|nr:hypothetical protein [Mycobacterium sp.]
MSKTTELNELQQLIGHLMQCVSALEATYGDAPAMRRIVNDAERILNGIDRLDIDTEELELACGLALAKGRGAMIQIPDADYDHGFWRDVDHEGVGGQRAS